MSIKVEEMKRLTDYWCDLHKLRDKVLEHAKTYAKTGHNRSTSYLHVDEYSYLFSANIEDFKSLFAELGYEVGIERYDNVKDGYLGEVRLYW